PGVFGQLADDSAVGFVKRGRVEDLICDDSLRSKAEPHELLRSSMALPWSDRHDGAVARALALSRAPRSVVPAQAYFAGSAVFHYLGPSFAVLLFARVDVLGVAWLRIAAAALVFTLWRRPWRTLQGVDLRGLRLLIGLGAVFAVMNACFYVAIDRLPLATVAAIEFIGPVALALFASRSVRNVAAVAAAAGGVDVLTHVRFGGQPVGVASALANAVLFTLYIVLAHRLSRRPSAGGVEGLAAAMLIACVIVTPIGVTDAAQALADPVALAAGIGVGVSSSVIPYA